MQDGRTGPAMQSSKGTQDFGQARRQGGASPSLGSTAGRAPSPFRDEDQLKKAAVSVLKSRKDLEYILKAQLRAPAADTSLAIALLKRWNVWFASANGEQDSQRTARDYGRELAVAWQGSSNTLSGMLRGSEEQSLRELLDHISGAVENNPGISVGQLMPSLPKAKPVVYEEIRPTKPAAGGGEIFIDIDDFMPSDDEPRSTMPAPLASTRAKADIPISDKQRERFEIAQARKGEQRRGRDGRPTAQQVAKESALPWQKPHNHANGRAQTKEEYLQEVRAAALGPDYHGALEKKAATPARKVGASPRKKAATSKSEKQRERAQTPEPPAPRSAPAKQRARTPEPAPRRAPERAFGQAPTSKSARAAKKPETEPEEEGKRQTHTTARQAQQRRKERARTESPVPKAVYKPKLLAKHTPVCLKNAKATVYDEELSREEVEERREIEEKKKAREEKQKCIKQRNMEARLRDLGLEKGCPLEAMQRHEALLKANLSQAEIEELQGREEVRERKRQDWDEAITRRMQSEQDGRLKKLAEERRLKLKLQTQSQVINLVSRIDWAFQRGTKIINGHAVKDIRSLFLAMDANRSGSINKDELHDGLLRLKVNLDEKALEIFFKELDQDLSGEIQLHELAKWWEQAEIYAKDAAAREDRRYVVGRHGDIGTKTHVGVRRMRSAASHVVSQLQHCLQGSAKGNCPRKLYGKEITDARSFFQAIDTDSTGTIHPVEIAAGLRRLDITMTEGDVQALVDSVDRDGDGEMDIAEVENWANFKLVGAAVAMQIREVYEEKRTLYGFTVHDSESLFEAIDLDGNGLLHFHEIVSGLRVLQLNIGHPEIDALIATCDKDRSGTIDKNEFIWVLDHKSQLDRLQWAGVAQES